jgi:hypothetical protein
MSDWEVAVACQLDGTCVLPVGLVVIIILAMLILAVIIGLAWSGYENNWKV